MTDGTSNIDYILLSGTMAVYGMIGDRMKICGLKYRENKSMVSKKTVVEMHYTQNIAEAGASKIIT